MSSYKLFSKISNIIFELIRSRNLEYHQIPVKSTVSIFSISLRYLIHGYGFVRTYRLFNYSSNLKKSKNQKYIKSSFLKFLRLLLLQVLLQIVNETILFVTLSFIYYRFPLSYSRNSNKVSLRPMELLTFEILESNGHIFGTVSPGTVSIIHSDTHEHRDLERSVAE